MFAKRFFYVCAGLLCLALTCLLAVPEIVSAQTQILPGARPALMIQVGQDMTSYDQKAAGTKLMHFEGYQPWATVTAVLPGGERWSMIGGVSWTSAEGDVDNIAGFQSQLGTYSGWKQTGPTMRTHVGMIIWLK
jgi:hypothetical protein